MNVKYLMILIFLILLLLLTVYGCVYAGSMTLDSNSLLYDSDPRSSGIIYYNSTGTPGVQTYFHNGEVTRCITTSSTVTCY